MKKWMNAAQFIFTALALGLFMVPVWAGLAGAEAPSVQSVSLPPGSAVLVPVQESEAFKRYQNRKKSELSKLIYLMDRFRGTGYTVIYDGIEYTSDQAALESRKYIAKNYKQEEALSWVRNNAYRSSPGGNVIQVKTPQGEVQLLRDVLVSELEMLQRVEGRAGAGTIK